MPNRVQGLDQLYEINGTPHESIVNKHTAWMTPLIKEFILASPFFLVATLDGAGNLDVSPKGDPAGTVKIIDSRTLVIPDEEDREIAASMVTAICSRIHTSA